MTPLRFILYSDYLCPWCYTGSVRLERIEREFEGRVEVEWRSFLLRPRPEPRRSLEKFRRYTESWQKPGADPDAPTFRPWHSDAGPPSHSIPAHLVAKAAAALGPDAFRRMHRRLLEAYFAESRDTSDAATLRELWAEVELPAGDFERAEDPALLERVIAEHNEAIEFGATGVPAVRLDGNDALLTGAQPMELYRRWAERALAS